VVFFLVSSRPDKRGPHRAAGKPNFRLLRVLVMANGYKKSAPPQNKAPFTYVLQYALCWPINLGFMSPAYQIVQYYAKSHYWSANKLNYPVNRAICVGSGFVVTRADIFPPIAARGVGQILLVGRILIFGVSMAARNLSEYRSPMSYGVKNHTGFRF